MNFRYDIGNLTPDQIKEIIPPTKVSDFIEFENWKLDTLKRYLPESIIQQINNVRVPINNIEDKICWKFTLQAPSLLNL